MKNQPLMRYLMLWTILLVWVPSLLIMAIFTYSQFTVAEQKNKELISQRVAFQRKIIDSWMAERCNTVRELSRTEPFRLLDEHHMLYALNLMQDSDFNFDSLSYIDKDGIFRMTTLRQEIRYPSAAGKPYYEFARIGKEFISDVVIGRNSGQAIINFSCPVYDLSESFQGLILGSIKMSTLEALLRENWFGETGEIIIVNREGFMLTNLRFLTLAISQGFHDSTAKINVRISDDALNFIHRDLSGTGAWIDYRGNKVLGSYVRIPEQDWTIIGKIDEAEVLSPIYDQTRVIAASSSILVLLIFLLSTFVTLRIKRPIDWLIEQSNHVATEDYATVGQKRLSAEIPRELEILCQTFVKMSNTIRGTIGLIKAHERQLESKVLEIEKGNKALENQINERQTIETALKRQLKMEEILAKISRNLILCSIEDIDEAVGGVLKLIGEFTNVDRCAIFLDNTAGVRCEKRHFWSRVSDNRFAAFAGFDIAENRQERAEFRKFEALAVSSIRDLPLEFVAGQKFMADFRLKALLSIPIVEADETLGFLFLATVREAKVWRPEETAWLKIVAELIINSIERKRIHDAFALRDKEYRALLDAVPDIFFEIDKNGIFRSARGLLSRNLLPPEKVIGKSVFDIYPPEVAQRLLDSVQMVIASQTMKTIEYDIVIDNTKFMREARIVSKKDNEALVVVRDISEEKRAEQKMVEAGRLMEEGQRLASLGVMATGIAHEINQPLNSIKISASGMIFAHNNGVKLDKDSMLREFAWISEQADRIDEIIKSIRMFVKNEYSTREVVDFGSVIDQAVKTIASHSLLKEVSLKICAFENSPLVLANHIHLQQVIINLVVNAAQALSQAARTPKIIKISAWTDDKIVMEVSDNGMGLPEDLSKRFFEPFFTLKSDDQAMGLGLSIVQTIVNAYGGEVNAYNNEEGGATFRVVFPKIT